MTAPVRTRPTVHPRIGHRRVAVTRARGRRRLKGVAVLGGVVVVAVAALSVLHSPLFSARHVTVRGAHHVSVQQVLGTARLAGAPPLLDVNAGADAARLESLPWVARASVVRRWPDSVVVTVHERVPVAVVAPSASGTGFALVDGGGHVIEWLPAAPTGLPVLDSPAVAGRPGTVLGSSAAPGLAVASAVLASLPGRVQTVTVSGGTVRLELGGGVEVVVGRAVSLGSKMAALRSVLSGAPPKGPETIDVTVPGEPTVGPASS